MKACGWVGVHARVVYPWIYTSGTVGREWCVEGAMHQVSLVQNGPEFFRLH